MIFFTDDSSLCIFDEIFIFSINLLSTKIFFTTHFYSFILFLKIVSHFKWYLQFLKCKCCGSIFLANYYPIHSYKNKAYFYPTITLHVFTMYFCVRNKEKHHFLVRWLNHLASSSFVNIKDWKNFPQKFHNFWKKEFQDHNFHNKKAIPAATCGSYSLIKEVTH